MRPADRAARDSATGIGTAEQDLSPAPAPIDADWGNPADETSQLFRVSNQSMPAGFIHALALIKASAAQVNRDLGLISPNVAKAIAQAAQDVADGRHDEMFPIDVYQTGSGTSSNMNANEVIAALAAEAFGAPIDPRNDVNKGQSSNDVVPTAMQVAFARALVEDLRPALDRLSDRLREKQLEFWDVLKLARTHLQDATPIRLGQEFLGYVGQVERGIELIDHAIEQLSTLPLGGTAVGTGINAHSDFADGVARLLSERTGIGFAETSNHFAGQSTLDVVIAAHSAVRSVALSLLKVGTDLRLLASGPNGGFAEITIPHAGVVSSIMPGKSPPAIIESLTMVVARVFGNDATVAFAQTGSILELNVMMPVVIASTLESVSLLASICRIFADDCVAGIQATDAGPRSVVASPMLATALTPLIGYDAATSLAFRAADERRPVRELAEELGLPSQELDHILDPYRMTRPERP